MLALTHFSPCQPGRRGQPAARALAGRPSAWECRRTARALTGSRKARTAAVFQAPAAFYPAALFSAQGLDCASERLPADAQSLDLGTNVRPLICSSPTSKIFPEKIHSRPASTWLS